ncbi:MAG: hypothetical protein R3A52_06170 [Polyangiales bacterium]
MQTRERALFQRASETVAELLRRDGVDPETRRRAHLWRRGIEGLALLGDPECTALVERYEHALNAHTFTRDGRALNRSDLQRMSRSADPAERRAAWDLTALHRDVAPIARDLLRRRAAVARAMGSTSWGDRMLSLRGIEPAQWSALARDLATRTDEAWHTVLTEGAQARRLDRVRPWDLDFALQREGAVADARLPADTAVDRARRILTGWGFDLDHPPVRVVVREFSFGGQTLSIRVLTDVRTVVRPKAGAEFLRTLMHELGHALQATRTATPYPIARGYEWVPGLTALADEVWPRCRRCWSTTTRCSRATPTHARRAPLGARRGPAASSWPRCGRCSRRWPSSARPSTTPSRTSTRSSDASTTSRAAWSSPTTRRRRWAATPFLATHSCLQAELRDRGGRRGAGARGAARALRRAVAVARGGSLPHRDALRAGRDGPVDGEAVARDGSPARHRRPRGAAGAVAAARGVRVAR